MKSTNLRMIAFLAVGLAALAVAMLTTQFRFAAVIIALAAFLLGGTAFSNAGRLATSLAPYVKRSVRVQVWGTFLGAEDGSRFEIESIKAAGAGLLIYLRASPEGKRTLLKVAQPGSARLEESRVEIAEARYVSWGGRRLTLAVGQPAVVLLIMP